MKGMENCARKWYLFLCTILFEAFCKMCAFIYELFCIDLYGVHGKVMAVVALGIKAKVNAPNDAYTLLILLPIKTPFITIS